MSVGHEQTWTDRPLSTDQLAQFRVVLEADLDAQRLRIASLGPEGEALDDLDPADAEALATRAAEAVEEIEKALRRIDDGTYGACHGCGVVIPHERLEAVPSAALCVRCQGRAATLLG